MQYVPTPVMQQAVKDAQYLLEYVAQSNKTLDRDIVKTLITSKSLLRDGHWSPDQEMIFWQAFTQINERVKPVTITSLRAIVPGKGRPFSRARISMRVSQLLTMGTLTVLILTQIYWIIGAALVHKIDDLIEKRQNLTQLEKTAQETAKKEAASQARSLKAFAPADTLPFLQEELSHTSLDKQLEANYEGLLTWSKFWQKLLFMESDFKGKNVLLDEQMVQETIYYLQRNIETNRRMLTFVDENQKALLLKRIAEDQREQQRLQTTLDEEKSEYERVLSKLPAEFVLEVLQSYILPLLYGLLGASIYVLRSMTEKIDALTYTGSVDVEYGLRLALGALGALGIGWFLMPENISALQSLSPWAISFLTGYNIELLFSVMDNVIETLSAPSDEQTKPPATQPGAAKS